MSTLSVTKINTSNASIDLTITTGNSATGGMVVQSNGNAVVLQSNSTTNAVYVYADGDVKLPINNQKLAFTAKSGANVYFIQQNDDNFVFYSTNSTGGSRPVYSVFANSSTSNLSVSIPMQVAANLTVTTNNFTLGSSATTANGYTYLPNGLLMQWGTGSANVTTAAQSFPIPFTSSLYSITLSQTSNSIGAIVYINASNSTTFTPRSGNASGQTYYYMAIGV